MTGINPRASYVETKVVGTDVEMIVGVGDSRLALGEKGNNIKILSGMASEALDIQPNRLNNFVQRSSWWTWQK